MVLLKLNESKLKPNKLWVDQARQLYNKIMLKLLDDNGISMYYIYSKSKLVVAVRFIRTLKRRIYKQLWRAIVYLIFVIWIS